VAAPVLFVWQLAKYVMTGTWPNVSLGSLFKLLGIKPGILVESTQGFGRFPIVAEWISYKIPLALYLFLLGIVLIYLLGRFVRN
jgi:hypothetical protein